MNKYEQLIEHIINDETDKARELFHTIVVEKSRDIYENLIDEQDLDEVGGNEVEDLVDEITIDEQGMTEEEEGEEGAEEAPAMDADEMPSEEGHEEAEIEDRVVDLEDALDELKAEFDALMAGEEHEEEAMPGMHGDKDADEMEGMMYQEEQSEFFEAKDEDEDEEDKEEDKEDKEVVKEYVEKVAAPSNKTEGGEVGKGGSANVNKASPLAGKNDMGGSAANIATGKANPDPNGTSPKATVKPKGELKGAGSYENVPGAKAGQAFAKKETAVKAEVGGVNKTSPLAK